MCVRAYQAFYAHITDISVLHSWVSLCSSTNVGCGRPQIADERKVDTHVFFCVVKPCEILKPELGCHRDIIYKMHQTKYYIKRFKHNIGCVALAIIIFSAIIMVLQFLSCIFCRNCGNRDFYITIIGYFIAIANALLLYETLNSQKEELLADERDRLRDRFETTLFSLLNFHRKLTDEIVICNPYMNNDGLEDNNEYKGGDVFCFRGKRVGIHI